MKYFGVKLSGDDLTELYVDKHLNLTEEVEDVWLHEESVLDSCHPNISKVRSSDLLEQIESKIRYYDSEMYSMNKELYNLHTKIHRLKFLRLIP